MSKFEQGHALVVGVGADLPNTADDARGMADILKDEARCAYPAEQVHLLTNAEATRANILDGLKRLAETAGEEATVVVYFSGHGYRIKTMTGHKYFIMPNGYDDKELPDTAVSGDELAAGLRAIKAQKLLLLLDCCHAGGLDDLKAPGVTLTKVPIPDEVVSLLDEGSGRAVIASSRADEVSYAGKPYSAFTLALIEGFCGDGVAKQDGFVRVADLALHTREMVPRRTKDRQHPTLNYEQADNYRVAYYAAGETQPKGLPFDIAPEIEPEPGAFGTGGTSISYQAHAEGQSTIAQGRGATAVGSRGVNIGGSVGGSVVTGDNNIVSGRDTSIGVSGAQLQQLFAPVLEATAAAPPEKREEARETAAALQEEAGKGEEANDSRMARLIDKLVDLVPGAVSAVVSTFASPLLAGVAGPVTKFMLEKITRQ